MTQPETVLPRGIRNAIVTHKVTLAGKICGARGGRHLAEGANR